MFYRKKIEQNKAKENTVTPQLYLKSSYSLCLECLLVLTFIQILLVFSGLPRMSSSLEDLFVYSPSWNESFHFLKHVVLNCNLYLILQTFMCVFYSAIRF